MAAPTLDQAYSSNDGRYVYVVFISENLPLLPSVSVSGFSIQDDAVSVPILSAVRKGDSGVDSRTFVLTLSQRLTALNTVTISYTADATAITNSADEDAEDFVDQEVVNQTSRPVPLEAYSAYTGQYIDVVFQDYDSTGILPATGDIPGFAVTVNSSNSSIATSQRLGSTGQNAFTVRLALNTPMEAGDVATVSYVADVPAIIDNTSAQVPALDFADLSVTNNTVNQVPPTFDEPNTKTSADGLNVYVAFSIYSEDENILPSVGNIPGFKVRQSGTDYVPVSAVRADGDTNVDSDKRTRTVKLTLATALSWTGGITVTYEPDADVGAVVTDDQIPPNSSPAFYLETVSNLVANRTKPIVSGTPSILNASPTYFDVVFQTYNDASLDITTANAASPSTTTTPGSAGFLVRVNGVPTAVTVSKPNGQTYRFTKASGSFTCEDLVTITYVEGGSNAVCDSSSLKNRLASFSLLSVTNSINDTVGPTFSWAQVMPSGGEIEVYLVENRTPPLLPAGPTAVTGFLLQVNGAPMSFDAVRKSAEETTILLSLNGKIVPNDIVKLAYVSGNVTDSIPNAMTFPTGYQDVTNNSLYGFGLLADESLSFNSTVESMLYERRYGGEAAKTIIDRTPPAGSLIVNESPQDSGVSVHDFAAYGTTESTVGSGTAVEFLFDSKYAGIQFTSPGAYDITSITVQLKLSAATTGTNQYERVTLSLYSSVDNRPGVLIATSSVSVAFKDITTSFAEYDFALSQTLASDIDYWIVLGYTQAPANATLSIKASQNESGRIAKYVAVSASYDVTSGIQGWNVITGLDPDSSPLSGQTVIYDSLDQSLNVTNQFGGASNESLYETIGVNNKRSLIRFLSDNPLVSGIHVLATSQKPKMYFVDVKTSQSSSWQTVFSMVSHQNSSYIVKYGFAAPVSLHAIRMRYAGDYSTSLNSGKLTISSNDVLSGTVAVQLSRQPDFSDASAIVHADADGWIDISDGVTTFPWDFLDTTSIYRAFNASELPSPIKGAIAYSTGMVLFANKTAYWASPSSQEPSLVLTTDSTITSWCVHRGVLHVSCSNGKIYTSASGRTFELSYTRSNSITSLASFRGQLWSGESVTSSQSIIYTYDGSIWRSAHAFDGCYVSCMTVDGANLLIGTAGATAAKKGFVYVRGASSIKLSLSSSSDRVDAISPSNSLNAVLVGCSNGAVHQGVLNTSGDYVWSTKYAGDASRYFAISDDSSGQYTWVLGDTGMIGYVDAVSSFVGIDAISPGEASGLNASWANQLSSSYKTWHYTGEFVENVLASIDIANVSAFPSGVNEEYVALRLSGWISSSDSLPMDLKVEAEDGVRLTINNNLLIDSWDDQADMVEHTASMTFSANVWYPFSLDYFLGTSDAGGGASGVRLLWRETDSGDPFAVVGSTSFARPTNAVCVVYLGTQAYVVMADGLVKEFDPSYYASNEKVVYMRLKDAAGNITAMPGINDGIIKSKKNLIDGVRIADGKIYQVSSNKSLEATYTAPASEALSAPHRLMRESGIYVSSPFYASTLTRWDSLTMLVNLAAGTAQGLGLEYGVSAQVYVRTGNNEAELLAADWGVPFEKSTIAADGSNVAAGIASYSFNISAYAGKWLQYKLVVNSASRSLSPEVRAVTLTYIASNASYFFTKLFDTANLSDASPSPVIKRGILTSNYVENGGSISYFYTTESASPETFDIAKYTPIIPNTVFSISSESSVIRVAALLVSADSMNLAVIDEFALQLDTGEYDLKWM